MKRTAGNLLRCASISMLSRDPFSTTIKQYFNQPLRIPFRIFTDDPRKDKGHNNYQPKNEQHHIRALITFTIGLPFRFKGDQVLSLSIFHRLYIAMVVHPNPVCATVAQKSGIIKQAIIILIDIDFVCIIGWRNQMQFPAFHRNCAKLCLHQACCFFCGNVITRNREKNHRRVF